MLRKEMEEERICIVYMQRNNVYRCSVGLHSLLLLLFLSFSHVLFLAAQTENILYVSIL